MTQEKSIIVAVCPDLLYAQLQIKTELSRNREFSGFVIKSNVWLENEIVDLVVDGYDSSEIYLIRPFFCSRRDFNEKVEEQLNGIVCRWRNSFKKDGVAGRGEFMCLTPYIMDYSKLLIYWCNGDGIIYYQWSQKSEFLLMIKLFVANLNFLYIQYLKSRKYT